jgi:hypothetical protein
MSPTKTSCPSFDGCFPATSRPHTHLEHDDSVKDGVVQPQKTGFKLFDFFANCEYFEEKFNYDALKLVSLQSKHFFQHARSVTGTTL